MARPATHHDLRRRELIAAAERVFVDKGYAATTLNDLLTATGTSKGGFYHYFRSKDEVLRAALDGVLDEAEGIMQRAASLDAPPLDRLATIFRGMRTLRAGHGEFSRTLAVIVTDQTPAKAFHDDLVRRLAPPLATVLAGFPLAEPDETAELILDLLTSVSRSPRRDQILTDPLAQSRYTTAVRELIGATLGIGKDNPTLLELR